MNKINIKNMGEGENTGKARLDSQDKVLLCIQKEAMSFKTILCLYFTSLLHLTIIYQKVKIFWPNTSYPISRAAIFLVFFT